MPAWLLKVGVRQVAASERLEAVLAKRRWRSRLQNGRSRQPAWARLDQPVRGRVSAQSRTPDCSSSTTLGRLTMKLSPMTAGKAS